MIRTIANRQSHAKLLTCVLDVSIYENAKGALKKLWEVTLILYRDLNPKKSKIPHRIETGSNPPAFMEV